MSTQPQSASYAPRPWWRWAARRTPTDGASRDQRNRLEQLQADAKRLEQALARIEGEIAAAAGDADGAEGRCLEVEARLFKPMPEQRR